MRHRFSHKNRTQPPSRLQLHDSKRRVRASGIFDSHRPLHFPSSLANDSQLDFQLTTGGTLARVGRSLAHLTGFDPVGASDDRPLCGVRYRPDLNAVPVLVSLLTVGSMLLKRPSKTLPHLAYRRRRPRGIISPHIGVHYGHDPAPADGPSSILRRNRRCSLPLLSLPVLSVPSRPGAAGRQRPLLGRLHLTSRAVTVVVKQSPMVEQAGYPTLWPSLFATFDRLSKSRPA